MLIHTRLPAGHPYPQLIEFPANYADFLAAFRGGQTVDNNMYLTTGNAVQTNMYKTAIASGHLTPKANPIQGEYLLDIFLTDAGAEHILVPQDRQFCELAVELAKKSVAEDDGELHPAVGALVVKDGKVLSTGYRGETGKGRHAEYCALRKLNDDVDNVDLSGCTVYTTLEPCSKREKPKTPCAERLIKATVARVVFGMLDKDKEVYGGSSLAEAGVHIGFFPSDLMQELLARNREWSDSRREAEVMPLPNDTAPIAVAEYYKPGTSMQDNIRLYVRPPKGEGFYTIEDAAKNVLACSRTIDDIAVKWRQIDVQKVIVEKLKRNGHGCTHPQFNLNN